MVQGMARDSEKQAISKGYKDRNPNPTLTSTLVSQQPMITVQYPRRHAWCAFSRLARGAAAWKLQATSSPNPTPNPNPNPNRQ
jgi:hypothetical protein